MKLVLVGVSGVLGRQIYKRIRNKQHDLILVGRNKKKLEKIFPGEMCCDYYDYETFSESADALIYLSAVNNDISATYQEYEDVNVVAMSETFHSCRILNIDTFIYFSSMNVVGLYGANGEYAKSKLRAEQLLAKLDGMNIVNLRLSAVYGDVLTGKLSIFNNTPKFLKKQLMVLLGVVKPVISIDAVVKALLDGVSAGSSYTKQLTDTESSNSAYGMVKRVFDICISLLLLVLLFWLFPIVWLLIKIDSHGPGFFVQTRVGKGEKLFSCYKFRTMALDTEEKGTHFVSNNSVTRVGKILRVTKIDELPQLVNVLKNDMSFTGPRPCLLNQTELIKLRSQKDVFSIKPGITGLAQIRGVDMSDPEKLAGVDFDYVGARGFILDIKILFATLFGKGFGDKTRKL